MNTAHPLFFCLCTVNEEDLDRDKGRQLEREATLFSSLGDPRK